MSHKAKIEYFNEIHSRYKTCSKKEKQSILDEFCRICSYNRKYAIRLLNGKKKNKSKAKKKKTGRPRYYNNPVILHFLKVLLRSTNMICSKRLKAIIPLWLPFYEQTFCLKLTEPNKEKLLRISPATIDRILSKDRKKFRKLGLSTTKPGSLLKKQVAVKTNQWDEKRVGFIEADTVAHCGTSVSGMFIYTVNTVDIATGWIESRAIWGKGEKSTFEAIRNIEENLPFKIRGFDCDNGSEFLNWHLMKYFTGRSTPVDYTRSRAYQKNDNAHIEGKNWTHIRQFIGYKRLENKDTVTMLNEIYTKYWSDYFNYFIPSEKLLNKQRVGAKTIKIHDKPKTPFQRLLESTDVSVRVKKELTKKFKQLNPFELEVEIHARIIEILNLN